MSEVSRAKNVTICFRTSEELQDALKKLGDNERRSVSAIIEHALGEYVREKGQTKRLGKEKRRHARRKVGVPALVTRPGSDQEVQAAVVLDISLGGLRVSVPDTFRSQLEENEEGGRVRVVFTLPQTKRALTVDCTPKYVLPSDDGLEIGAAFSDADFASYQSLQNYLLD